MILFDGGCRCKRVRLNAQEGRGCAGGKAGAAAAAGWGEPVQNRARGLSGQAQPTHTRLCTAHSSFWCSAQQHHTARQREHLRSLLPSRERSASHTAQRRIACPQSPSALFQLAPEQDMALKWPVCDSQSQWGTGLEPDLALNWPAAAGGRASDAHAFTDEPSRCPHCGPVLLLFLLLPSGRWLCPYLPHCAARRLPCCNPLPALLLEPARANHAASAGSKTALSAYSGAGLAPSPKH